MYRVYSILIIVTFLLGSEPDERGYIVSVGDMAPDFTMEYTTGEKVTLSDLRDKIVVLLSLIHI